MEFMGFPLGDTGYHFSITLIVKEILHTAAEQSKLGSRVAASLFRL